MLISLDRIVSGNQVRLQPVTDGADAALADSIAAIGLLQPVLVRPVYQLTQIEGASIPVNGGNGMFEIVDGHRRVTAARMAGRTEIEADVREMDDAAVAAAQAAGNALHQALHPVDLWLAARDMLRAGMSERQAARAIGLSERDLRGMNWLANLHHSILGLCRLHMPDLRTLRKIAVASLDLQAQAAELPGIRTVDDRGAQVAWYRVSSACADTRASKAWARFDVETSGLAWDEDLFAEPGSEDQFTTADLDGFMAAQRAALTAQAEAEGHTKRIVIEQDGRSSYAKVPAGYERVYGEAKPKRGWLIADVLSPSGRTETWILKPKKAPTKPSAAGDAEDDDSAGDGFEDREDGDEGEDDPPPPAPDVTGITKAGLAMIAERKTKAVKARLMAGDDIDAHDLLALMVLAFSCDNVSGGWHAHEVEEKLIAPDGTLRDDADESVIRACARTVLANVVRFSAEKQFSDPGSGCAGEWIGRLINAEKHLGRFDDEKFLATLRGDMLRKVAEAARVKWSGTATAMRDRLQGQAEAWTPDAAVFGAPGPR